MKHRAALVTVLPLAAATAHARLGETEKEIAARYGVGEKAHSQRLAGAETLEYRKDDTYVEVVLFGRKSVLERYAPKNGTTEDFIRNLLKLNSRAGATWRFDRKANRWERQGTPKLVAYRWPGHPGFVCIKDLKACEAAEELNKPSVGGL